MDTLGKDYRQVDSSVLLALPVLGSRLDPSGRVPTSRQIIGI